MRTSTFRTRSVFDHSVRALDELRRMDFVLISMTIATDDTDGAVVRIDFEPNGSLLAETWFERIRKMPGVFDCRDLTLTVDEVSAIT